MKVTFFILQTLILFLVQYNVLTKSPIIGIVTNPEPINSSGSPHSSMLFSTYLKWLDNSGAKVVPILPWYSDKTVDKLLSKINGILFMGGDRDLDLDGYWETFSEKLLYKVLKLNEADNNIPIWGTCQGFELIHAHLAGTVKILQTYDAWKIMSPIQFYPSKDTVLHSSKMFNKFPLSVLNDLEEYNFTLHFHRLGISVEAYQKYKDLNKYLKITSVGKDKAGREFVNTVEGLGKYNIFAVQFHPEKYPLHKLLTNDEVKKYKDAMKSLADNFLIEANKHLDKFSQMRVDEYLLWRIIDTKKYPPLNNYDGYMNIPIYLYTVNCGEFPPPYGNDN